ncbi:hypothetical protein BC628DRAFT_1417249 [Trametes gibbosa]|nr:hypothetical protein BC628DRAFT_1417249 [Trametes gibbosa]
MFTLRPGANVHVEGQTDENPITVPNVKAIDFERFLSMFYPRDVVHSDLTTLEEWTSVLRIAHMYDFKKHSMLAAEQLHTLVTPVDRLLLSREFDIPEWLEPAYYDLGAREATLTYEEGMRLGMAEVIFIADLRQRVRFMTARGLGHHVFSTVQSMLAQRAQAPPQ